jgi:hypothetical protein
LLDRLRGPISIIPSPSLSYYFLICDVWRGSRCAQPGSLDAAAAAADY